MKPAEAAATPSRSCWRRRDAGYFLAPLALVLLLYGQSVYRSPAFGQLADQGYHLAALESWPSAWRSGWDAQANGGRGSPGFVLYPPLFTALTAALVQTGLGSIEALRCAFLLSAVALYGGAFYLSLPSAGPKRAAMAAATTCLLPGATFPALARGMYPAFLALAFVALLLGALDRTRSRSAPLAAGLAAAGLILTHTLTAYMALFLILLAGRRLARRRGLSREAFAGAAALLLTAWFWGPMLLVSAQAQTGYLAEAHPYAHSLLGSHAPGDTKLARSWKLINGFGQAIAVAQLVLAAALAWRLRNRPQPLAVRILPAAAIFVALASAWPTGEWLATLPQFDKLQFAWRWQGPLAVLCGAAVAALPKQRQGVPLALAALVILGFLPLVQPAKRPWTAPIENPRPHTLAEYQELDPAERAAYLQNRIEMRPLGADRLLYPSGPSGRWEVVSGEGQVAVEELAPGRRTYRIDATTPITLRLLTYHFPGWRAELDGRRLAIYPEPGSGLQLVSLPLGQSTLRLSYSRFRF